MVRKHLVVLLCLSALGVTPAIAATSNAGLAGDIDRLSAEVAQLEAARAVKKLQRAFGYYADRGLWQEVSDLFVEDGTIEFGQDGVYVGKARIREYLKRVGGQDGLRYGQLNEYVTLQPVVTVAANARSAKARWRDLGMLGDFQKDAYWRDGVYENEYVLDGDTWKIRSVHLYINFIAPYEGGWARMKQAAADWRSPVAKAFPADRLPTGNYRPFPEAQLPPFHYVNPVTGKGRPTLGTPQGGSGNSKLGELGKRVALLKDQEAIENLQAAYGFYFDKMLWSDVSDLFTANGSFEYGQRGVYVGKERIRKALLLFGAEGPAASTLNNHMQLQPVVHVAPDGQAAKARWRGMVQLARPNASGQWGEGVYENEYVKEGGVWKISRLHFYITAFVDYDLGFAKSANPAEGPSALFPPDQPPTEIYRSFPGVYIPPFHYPHPVTGKPITFPQPTDSVLGRKAP